jgi:hypothetical protein
MNSHEMEREQIDLLLECLENGHNINENIVHDIIYLAINYGRIQINPHVEPEIAKLELQLQQKAYCSTNTTGLNGKNRNAVQEHQHQSQQKQYIDLWRSKSPTLGESYFNISQVIPTNKKESQMLGSKNDGTGQSSTVTSLCVPRSIAVNKESEKTKEKDKENENEKDRELGILKQRQMQLERTIEGLVMRLEKERNENRSLKKYILENTYK